MDDSSKRKSQPQKRTPSIVFCPQGDPLFPELTVRQHLALFRSFWGGKRAKVFITREYSMTSGAGGASSKKSPEEIVVDVVEHYADLLQISEKLDTECAMLSGGQKRRLWVATALLAAGSADILILDEPTSGLDTHTRAELWQILKTIAIDEKKAVIFSTHHLEEADCVADRKVLLANGRVRALGTSAQLKKAFGCGYWLRVRPPTKERDHSPQPLVEEFDEWLRGVLHRHLGPHVEIRRERHGVKGGEDRLSGRERAVEKKLLGE